MKYIHSPAYRQFTGYQQRGIALFLVLVFLVILTLIGVFAMQGVTLNERVARNQLDRNIAFQAAEAALRDAERDISRLKANGANCVPDDTTCRPITKGDSNLASTMTDLTVGAGLCNDRGLCRPAADNATAQVWEVDENWTKATTYARYTGATPLSSVATPPSYLIEYADFGQEGGVFYQITALGIGVDNRTRVTLQSTFKPK